MSERAMLDAVPRGEYVPTADQRVVMYGLTWADFEAFLAVRGDSGPRVTYLEGTLELMSPSADHETIKKRFAAVVEAYLDHLGIRYDGIGSWLVRRAPDAAGLEPDECYILHDKPKDRPDLALEVIWTSGGIRKLEVYRRLGVPEVWFWERDSVSYFVLTATGYEQRATSECAPGFDGAVLAEMLELDTLSEVRRALRKRFP